MKHSESNNNIRIIIAGGGTGGHIFPAIAVAQAIQQLRPNAEILFIGATGKMEMEKVPQAGYQIIGLTIAGFNRANVLKNISLPFKLVKSFFQVRSIFKNFKPTAVFGVGGYSSFPVLKYAQTLGIPNFIHESNAFAGKSNQWLGKNATKIFTGTKGMEVFFPADKIMVTGNPVRKNIVEGGYNKENALLYFGLSLSKNTVLIIGGSLGAASINKAIMKNLTLFFESNIQLIWQTGKPNASEYEKAAETFAYVYTNSFIDDMAAAYTAADIVISRSGAMAVAEICLKGKACVFVPYPHAAEDHQTFNAKLLVNDNAALMVKDSEVNEMLVPLVLNTLKDEACLQKLETNIKTFSINNADKVIAEKIIEIVESNIKTN
jgi:UDP-N-acetylglucosamine--N-acetylmuramyl-(pentapeptide) pyrophosphoryl-undecaprenol N-acetylglucosamine transferase